MATTKPTRVMRVIKRQKKTIATEESLQSFISSVKDAGNLESGLFLSKVYTLEHKLGGAELARIAKVDRSRITRWKKGEHPDIQNAEKINDLEYIYTRLSQFLASGSIEKWLMGFNGHLNNNRPIDLIADGRVAEVIAAIEQSEQNSYA